MAIIMLGCITFAPSAFASSGKGASNAAHPAGMPAISSSCSSPTFSQPNTVALRIAYVNKSYSVYVRQQPTTSSCAITTQGPTMNVVLVGGDQNGWYPVLYYFNQGCRSCSHYDWSHTGYIADFLLNTASTGYTCFQSSCPDFITYSATIPNSNNCSQVTDGYCVSEANKTTLYVTPYALTQAPNWWISSNSCPPDSGCAYVWNDDWWAN